MGEVGDELAGDDDWSSSVQCGPAVCHKQMLKETYSYTKKTYLYDKSPVTERAGEGGGESCPRSSSAVLQFATNGHDKRDGRAGGFLELSKETEKREGLPSIRSSRARARSLSLSFSRSLTFVRCEKRR